MRGAETGELWLGDTLSPLLLKAVLSERPRYSMDELNDAAVVEAITMDADVEAGTSLGDDAEANLLRTL